MEELEKLIDRKKELSDVNLMPPLVWAYIGDNVYEMFIRMHFINTTKLNPHKLHIEVTKYVKAKAQAETLNNIYDKLTPKEIEIVKRGRNAENHHLPKNADVKDYMYATAFEALLGYLFLSKQDERLKEILNMCI
jgi:ribonuclease-3 family protein